MGTTEAPEIITRAEGKAAGSKRYYTGKACLRGHIDERQVSNGACFSCRAENGAQRYAANIIRERERNRRWYAANIEQVQKGARLRARIWYRENQEKKLASVRRWKMVNPERYRALLGKSCAKERGAIIPEDFSIDATIPFYTEAHRLTEETGIPHAVDHIRAICLGGTHEATNLQVITAAENLRKSHVERAQAKAVRESTLAGT